ncbi:MAG TPA: PSD1 and planctomycete cytochrome C domain-containing protein [Pirellulales bacterium]|nr:PSD1 and planctomycete cytochrome C domain-containing protein [Pirellulales bacterium]
MPWIEVLTGSVVLATLTAGAARGGDVDFTRDVRPILSAHCFKCHGPDDHARQADLRLDVRENALRAASSGAPAIVPGKPDESELVRRLVSRDEDEMMPPPSAKLPLTDAEKQILGRWIGEGAKYVPHWAFVAPKRPPLPSVRHADWPRNGIDYFVLARLEAEGLVPSPAADNHTLVRRLYLDLIGMPPSPEEAAAFVNDASGDAYEKLVDRLLQSPHYGERWARRWLDLARYADTNGYEKDRARSMWPYRDWVINALNDDMPFDQFTIEQIAGDMLPAATSAQRIATGFHRNTMINEEGGIDPLEFRFHAMTDRVATTGTVWLGLTLLCCQCHTHKYDPIAQREYYQMMAFLNNADEPVMDIPRAEIAANRRQTEEKIQQAIDDLPNRFPLPDEYQWNVVAPAGVASAGGATLEKLDDGSILVSGAVPDKDTYTVVLDTDWPQVDAIRLEALADPKLPSNGPGRTPHGNFVLSELTVHLAPRDAAGPAPTLKLASATADFAQDGFPATHAIDGQTATGWAIQGPGQWNVNRTVTFPLDSPARIDGPSPLTKPSRWTITLDQQHGSQHTLGKFRVSLGRRNADSEPDDVRRRDHLRRKLAAWIDRETKRVAHWTMLRPIEAKANMPILSILDDGSILAGGDQTKRDVYDLKFHTELAGITAIRLEAIPDDRLPNRGPGRVFYEGGNGDFFLSDIALTANGKPAKFVKATHSFAAGKTTSANAIDDNPQSGWSINGRQGEAHEAVFNLAEPLPQTAELAVRMVFEMYYAAGLGRFRIWATTDQRPAEATGLPRDVERILLLAAEVRTAEQNERLLRHFVSIAPELAGEHVAIKKLRSEMAVYPTTLVMAERPAGETRRTHFHQRGEFLQPMEAVEPGVPAVLPPLSADAPKNRLALARWLVSPDNPLTGRVMMNRQWGAIFGDALVKTQEDFGFRGESPTHPELLDWLAVEFVRRNWSIKQMHRLMATSATYRQSSRVTPELLAKDPHNRLLARGPRFRIEAELVRDSALKISGLLSLKVGGPSVFPPQPPNVAAEGAYGALAWNVSSGADRYRRGVYTFSKRTAPYAMFNTFDSPSGEACVARREVSNTPLQALTLMNDAVFWEAAQALGAMLASRPGSSEDRISELFQRCLVRPPSPDELRLLDEFFRAQRERFAKHELDAAAITGTAEGIAGDRAAWTVVARAVLNLDETITKN